MPLSHNFLLEVIDVGCCFLVERRSHQVLVVLRVQAIEVEGTSVLVIVLPQAYDLPVNTPGNFLGL
jgi:hypothetical protein